MDTEVTFKQRIVPWLLALLALIPLCIVAYAGFFSRMKIDDFCVMATAKEHGAWGTMLYHFNSWSGSYTRFFLIGALGPLDYLAPAVVPASIVVSWLASLSLLVWQVIPWLGVRRSRLALSITLSAVIVFATINAFYSPRSIYWLVANTAYSLPFAPFTAYLALSLWAVRRSSVTFKTLAAGAVLCFLTAGLAEAFVVFQLTALSIVLLLGLVLQRETGRRNLVAMIGAGWLSTAASLIVQLMSPGVIRRSTTVAVDAVVPPVRAPSELVLQTVDSTLGFLSSPQLAAGFLMLTGVGMLVMLTIRVPLAAKSTSSSVQLGKPVLWIGLLLQLLFAPLLWLYVSDSPQFFGRFSSRYLVFVVINLVFILAYMALVWRRERVNRLLLGFEPGMWSVLNGCLIVFSTLLALEITAVRIYVWLYLLVTIVVFLSAAVWQPMSIAPLLSLRRGGFLLVLCLIITWVCQASIAATLLFARGAVFVRTTTAGPYLMVLSGLVWGLYLGYWVKSFTVSSPSRRYWQRFIKLALFVGIALSASEMTREQASLASEMQEYARQWDVNHETIIAARDSGQTPIIVDPLPRGFGNYMTEINSECYYGVTVIVDSE